MHRGCSVFDNIDTNPVYKHNDFEVYKACIHHFVYLTIRLFYDVIWVGKSRSHPGKLVLDIPLSIYLAKKATLYPNIHFCFKYKNVLIGQLYHKYLKQSEACIIRI